MWRPWILAICLPLAGLGQESPQADVRRILRDGDFQTAPPARRRHERDVGLVGDPRSDGSRRSPLTRPDAGGSDEASEAPTRTADSRRDRRRPQIEPGPRGPGLQLDWLGYGILAVAVAFLVAWLVQRLRNRAPSAATRPQSAPSEPRPRPLADYDALAAAGRHGEALAAAFQAAVAHLEARLGRRFDVAVTGREIARSSPRDLWEPMRVLAYWEERRAFADDVITPEIFAQAREALVALRGAA